jgi:hypothetical protein
MPIIQFRRTGTAHPTGPSIVKSHPLSPFAGVPARRDWSSPGHPRLTLFIRRTATSRERTSTRKSDVSED